MRIIETNANQAPSYNPGLWPAMEWSFEFWAGLLDKMELPVMVLGEDGTALVINGEAESLLGLAGAVGRALPGRLAQLAGDPGSGRRLVMVQTAEGPWLFTVKAFSLEGHPRAMVIVGEREPARGGVEESNGEGAAMVGEMGQKVKGPLAGIELYASILDEELAGREDTELVPIIEEIRLGVRELNEYLTSFESMTRTLNLKLEALDLAEVVDEALGAMGEIFKAKGVGVLIDQQAARVMGDRELLKQLFLNLLINAVEAMPGGGRLTVDLRGSAPGLAEVVITDTGPGIDIRMAREIFNPFYTTKDQPLGLGLAVSRRVVEAHGGRMVVGSDVTMGARVAVSLPGLDDGEMAGGLN
jgi:signal transduction histidine kinase